MQQLFYKTSLKSKNNKTMSKDFKLQNTNYFYVPKPKH